MTADTDNVTFSPAGDWGTVRWAAIYNEKPRTWRKRLFSWPWRPWQRYDPPLVVDLVDAAKLTISDGETLRYSEIRTIESE